MIENQHQQNAAPRLDQLVLLCHACGAVLITVAAQHRGVCSMCLHHRGQSEPQPVPRPRPKLTAKQPHSPRKRRRYPPAWFYEASLDEVMQLVNLITNSIGSRPLTTSLTGDPGHRRELQLIYARAAEQYFAADTPFGNTRDGLLRWFAGQLHDYQQRFRR
jgi:hypothetical protein